MIFRKLFHLTIKIEDTLLDQKYESLVGRKRLSLEARKYLIGSNFCVVYIKIFCCNSFLFDGAFRYGFISELLIFLAFSRKPFYDPLPV